MSVNKVILVGNVGKDPEVRYLENNVAVAKFSLATTEKGYKMNNGSVVPDRTEWHNIVMWRGLAEIAEKYIRKGSQVFIEGKLQNRTWDDKNGVKHYATEILCENMQMLGGKKSEGADAPTSTRPTSPVTAASVDETPFGGNDNSGDDDLPF
ncbi:MAG: single-stranded DNA-binding protein [Paludibacteraceae bacterium]|nr:single-stranded DNA-binding protein [Paludibacteraceae bacterium]MBP6284064.1 single-stranded DNA-binding protein [Paludibacteraceae bacterium]